MGCYGEIYTGLFINSKSVFLIISEAIKSMKDPPSHKWPFLLQSLLMVWGVMKGGVCGISGGFFFPWVEYWYIQDFLSIFIFFSWMRIRERKGGRKGEMEGEREKNGRERKRETETDRDSTC